MAAPELTGLPPQCNPTLRAPRESWAVWNHPGMSLMMSRRAGHPGRDSHLLITQHSSLNTSPLPPPPPPAATDFVEVAVLISHGQLQL